jgi:hypothetical protein
MTDREFFSTHEGHDIVATLTVAHCETCDAYHTLESARDLGNSR